MAEVRVSTILPTIKCSNCSVDIPISQLGDHVCSKVPPAPAARLDVLSDPFSPRKKSPLGLSANRQAPPKLQPVGTSTSISSIRLPFSTTSSGESSPRTASPVPSLSGRRSPYLPPSRSQTSPLPSRPPSDDISLPQDGAFPTFPTTRSRSTTPTLPAEVKSPFSRTQTMPLRPEKKEKDQVPEIPLEVKPSFARTQTMPVRPEKNEKAQLHKSTADSETSKTLQKLNGLSMGPFSAKKDVGEGIALKGHEKSPSMGSSRDFSSRPTSAVTLKSHNRKNSASSSVYTRIRSTSTVSSTTSRYAMDAPDVPAVPPLKNRDTTLQDSPTLPHEGQEKAFDFGLDESEKPSVASSGNSMPLNRQPSPERKAPEPPPEKKAPEPSPYSHKPRPSVTAAMAPLDSIGSSSSFKPSRSIRGRKASTASNRPTPSDLGIKTTPQDPPPVPAAFQKANHNSETSNHTPNESTSSNGSYSSGVRTGSSRSSPPLQESPQRQKPPAFEDIRNDNPFSGFQFDVDKKSPMQESFPTPKSHPPLAVHPPSPERARRPSAPQDSPQQGRLDHPAPLVRQRTTPFSEESRPPAPEEPPQQDRSDFPPRLLRQRTAPVIFEESRPYPPPFQHPDRQPSRYPSRAPSLSTEPTLPIVEPHDHPDQQMSPQQTSPDDYTISSAGSQGSLDHFQFAPAPSRPPLPTYCSGPPPPQRLRPPDKGICRGCNVPIRGKSVSSVDGRLTGRYHKGCFVCTTCGNPFLTADFYVLKNQPYCSRHYHELNNSLCRGCDRGIEGQYLETETYRKFHSYCFTCQECHKILRDDYFEWKGRTLCEQHAFRAAQVPSSGLGFGAGRRFPERRTTKLMMM